MGTDSPQPRFDSQTGRPLASAPPPAPLPYAPPTAAPPPPTDPQQQWLWYETHKKSMAAAYLFNIFLGGLGIHRFYCGKTGSGLAMCITWSVGFLTSCLWIGILPLMVVGVWALVDLFLTHGWVTRHNHMLAQQLRAAAAPGGPMVAHGMDHAVRPG